MKVPDFVAVGHMCCDLVDSRCILGGPASYAGLAAHKLGMNVGIVTSISDDFPFLDTFQGIAIKNRKTRTTTVFKNVYRNGTREQFVTNIAASLRAEDVPIGWTNSQLTYICPIVNEIQPGMVKRFRGALVGIGAQGWFRRWDDSGRVSIKEWENAEAVVSCAHVVVFSELDIHEPYAFAERLARFVPVVTVTQSHRGAELFLGSRRRIHVPAYPIREIEPTGAGDVFAAAFMIRYRDCEDPVEAAKFACCAASFVCEDEGALGIPTLQQVVERKRKYDALHL